MKCTFVSDFVPTSTIEFGVLEKNKEYKPMQYSGLHKIQCVRSEFHKLHFEKYTHVINMPGNFEHIRCVAKQFNIVQLDRRLGKYVSDFCSQSILLSKDL